MTQRIICLGNRAACTYKKHPQPPAGIPLDKLELWAQMVCDLDISAVPKIGDTMKDKDGNDAYTVTAAHRVELLSDLIDRPVLASVLTDQKLCTRINVSPESSLMQAVDECLRVWRGTGSAGVASGGAALPAARRGEKPAWIAGTWPALVAVLADEMGVTDIREYDVTLDPHETK